MARWGRVVESGAAGELFVEDICGGSGRFYFKSMMDAILDGVVRRTVSTDPRTGLIRMAKAVRVPRGGYKLRRETRISTISLGSSMGPLPLLQTADHCP